MRLLLTTLLATLLFTARSGAQGIKNPIHWQFSIEHVSGDEYDLIFDAKIDKHWTLYSQHIAEGGPVPTEFTFEDSPAFKRIGEVKESDNAKTIQDKIFEMQLIKFYDYAKFTQRVKVSDASKPVVGYVTFMTCNDEMCLPPTDVDFSFEIPKTAGKPGTESGDKSDAGNGKQAAGIAHSEQVPQSAPPKTMSQMIDPAPEAGASGKDGSVQENEQTKITSDQSILPEIGTPQDQSGIRKPVKWTFKFDKENENTYKLISTALIDDGWHIYTQHIDPDKIGPVPTSFHFELPEGASLIGEVEESGPERSEGYDRFFDMELVKYDKEATFVQTVKAEGTPVISGELEFAVCNDEMCLPPEEVPFRFDLSETPGIASGAAEKEAVVDGDFIDQTIPTIVSTYKDPVGGCDAEGEQTAAGKSLIWTFVLGFLGGLLALLTPCVFPMIPLTVSYFSKDTKRKGWVNGAIYGGSIVVIYVTLGLLITGLFGATALNALSTNWIANTLFFLIFVVFAFSFFGYYEITLPSSWTNKSDSMADKGGLIGIFFMAFTLALVSFSCTGPIIGSALVESAKSTSGPLVVMLGFSLALALPFGLFAAFPAWLNSLPRSGSWMTSVKVVLGFLELALALKFLSVADMTSHWNFLKYELFLGAWVLIAAAMAAYLFGWIRFPHDSPMKKISFPRLSMALAISALAVYLATGFMSDKRTQTYNSLAMLSGLAPPAHYNFFRPVPGVDPEIKAKYPSYSKCANNLDCFHDYYEGVAYAKEVGKPVFLDFTGYGCVNCRKTEEHIWIKDKVWERLKNDFVMVSLYVDDREPLEPVLISKTRQDKLRNVGKKWADFQIVNFAQNTQPLYVIMTPEGEVLTRPRGYRESVDGYVNFLDCGLRAYERTSSLIGKQ